jgi:basic membrane protein A
LRRFVARALPALLLSTLVLTAAPGHAASPGLQPHKSVSVALYISGSLGDLGFFDSANAGVQRAAKELGAQVKVIQQSDSTQWQAQIEALARSKKYDLIIADASDPTVATAMSAVSKQFPSQRLIDFDDNQFAKTPSVSSIIYKQNEGSFLAGALAAMVADGNLKYTSGKKIIGMVGGQPVQVILDFKVGYVQGAHAVDPKMDVRVTYIGGSGGDDTWNNKAAGARLAHALYSQGAAVVYQVAGGSGLGVLDQSKLVGRYAIGVDSNQDAFAPGHVIGSVVKRVDNSLFDLINLYSQGKLQGAHVYYYGLQNHGVDLTRDKYTNAIISKAMYDRLDHLRAQVMSGKIKVDTAFK